MRTAALVLTVFLAGCSSVHSSRESEIGGTPDLGSTSPEEAVQRLSAAIMVDPNNQIVGPRAIRRVSSGLVVPDDQVSEPGEAPAVEIVEWAVIGCRTRISPLRLSR